MLIIWGKKRTVRRVGSVADFCPSCRGVQRFRVSRIGLVSHVYYLSLGAGDLVGHIAECQVCGYIKETEPTIYREMRRNATEDLAELVRATYPDLPDVYEERLRLEQKLRSGRPAA